MGATHLKRELPALPQVWTEPADVVRGKEDPALDALNQEHPKVAGERVNVQVTHHTRVADKQARPRVAVLAVKTAGGRRHAGSVVSAQSRSCAQGSNCVSRELLPVTPTRIHTRTHTRIHTRIHTHELTCPGIAASDSSAWTNTNTEAKRGWGHKDVEGRVFAGEKDAAPKLHNTPEQHAALYSTCAKYSGTVKWGLSSGR